MDPERQKRLNEVARIAVKVESETGLPAPLLIAQWAIESRWGAKPSGNANYFGIKKADRHKKCCVVTTHEVIKGYRVEMDLEFADYDSLEESCRDYAWLITHGRPYSEAWRKYQRDKSVHALVFDVARTYATDPSYSGLALQIYGQTNVKQAIAAVSAS
jgi:flagellum-specific peptidoglycan hydrolase FlgJ